jgi:hypothetical protein
MNYRTSSNEIGSNRGSEEGWNEPGSGERVPLPLDQKCSLLKVFLQGISYVFRLTTYDPSQTSVSKINEPFLKVVII